MSKYCFFCLFRADVAASGLAFRIPLLWFHLSSDENLILIINESLAKKCGLDGLRKSNIYIIPEIIGFKISVILLAPLFIAFQLFNGCRRFHLSAGAAFYASFFRLLNKFKVFGDIKIHTSIGSASIAMASGGIKRYENMHRNLLMSVDKIDCLYSAKGFPGFEKKFVQSPGSFSWKYAKNKSLLTGEVVAKKEIIVFSATLTAQKNGALAIEGCMLYFSTNPNSLAELHIFAPKIPLDFLARVDAINHTLGRNAIIFRNFEDLDNCLATSFIFLSLQDFDNYPSQSLIEAMSHGCTVIATDVGETRRLVRYSDGNFLIRADAMELRRALSDAFSRGVSFNTSNFQHVKNTQSIEVYGQYFIREFLT